HWKGYHYLVLYEAGAHQVTLGDPAEGLVSKARQTFEQDGWTGNLILLTPTPRLGQVAQVPSLWVGTRQLLTSGRGLIAGLLLLSTLVAALTLTIPLLLGQLFDAAVGGAGTHSQLGRLCGWLFLAGLGLGVGLTARRLLLERLIAQEATWLSASALQN